MQNLYLRDDVFQFCNFISCYCFHFNRRRTNSGRSPVTPSASLQDLLQKGEGVVSMSPKSPDSEGPHHHFGSPENKNDLSLTEEQLVHTVGGEQ